VINAARSTLTLLPFPGHIDHCTSLLSRTVTVFQHHWFCTCLTGSCRCKWRTICVRVEPYHLGQGHVYPAAGAHWVEYNSCFSMPLDRPLRWCLFLGTCQTQCTPQRGSTTVGEHEARYLSSWLRENIPLILSERSLA
jgi:hypothetical protein